MYTYDPLYLYPRSRPADPQHEEQALSKAALAGQASRFLRVSSSHIKSLQADVQHGTGVAAVNILRRFRSRLSRRPCDPLTGVAVTGFLLCVVLLIVELGTDVAIVWTHADCAR